MASISFPKIPFSVSKLGFVVGSLAVSQWAFNDLIHLPGGGLSVVAAGAGAWILLKSPKSGFKAPKTVKGWLSRCNEVLDQFDALEDKEVGFLNRKKRFNELEMIMERSSTQKVSFISTRGVDLPDKSSLRTSLDGIEDIQLSLLKSLPVHDEKWSLPKDIFEQDVLVYFLELPLRAADLLWLKKIPEDQPAWVVVSADDSTDWVEQLKALQAQLPEYFINRVLKWKRTEHDISRSLRPVRKLLENPKKNSDITRQRLLSKLHSSWQNDLESLRREKFKSIQNRSQWLVAGTVFASPVPSTDLLAVAVVNGLMIKDMGQLWSCSLRKDLLQAVARQLALAAIAQGLVEWSTQALLGIAKLHGGSWVAAGTMQALSAAYLTRVVGRSMADWMALNNGVTSIDLNLLKQQAPQLISDAMEKERIDWKGFLKQAKNWIDNPEKDSSLTIKSLEAF